MTPHRYVPRRGHVVWISFNPQAGYEQAGRCPALVISPGRYNARVGLALLCPITHHAKGYPFEVGIPPETEVTGVVLSDQVKSLDWRVRQAEFICQVPRAVIDEVLDKLGTLVSPDETP